LKLENVMVTTEYNIQLIDFGMCHMLAPGVTTIQGICGSPGYIAPEICLNEKGYDVKIDMFSVGVICYAMFTGALPFMGADIEKKLEANVQCRLRFNHPKFDTCSNDFMEFLRSMIV
jgi:calcium/calmodulin-dependent protein kinase (CaM kinase) II